jgi:acyl-CoA thioesterase
MSVPHPFDAAIALRPLAPGVLSGETPEAYSNFNGQFGGITVATLLRATLDADGAQGVPVSLTVHFTAGVKPGPFQVATRLIRRGRTLQHWSAELSQGETVAATALTALAVRSPSWSHAALAPPAAPPPEAIAPLDMSLWKGWATQYDFRFAAGSIAGLHGQPPFETPQSARSLLWLRHAAPRPLDFPGLACMSDAFFVRMIQVRNTFPAMGTVSLTTYFHCDAAALAAQGSDYLLCHVDSRVFRDMFHDQSAELWSRDGRLLANTHQIVWFAG